MLSSVEVIKPANEVALISLYEARLGLNLASSTSDTLDDQLEMMIRWASDEVATMCNRIFARETVIETVRQAEGFCPRLFLSHFPVKEIISISEDGEDLFDIDDYSLDTRSGMLTRLGTSCWFEPTVITYVGGYELPFEAPPALQQAAVLLTREAYNAAIRGDSTIRMVGHKDSRVIYFDPNAAAKGAIAGGGGSPARRATADLLKKFTRFWI